MNEDWTLRSSNPHTMQSDHPLTNVPFTRLLSPDAPRMAYRRRVEEAKSVVHWGQRKLLLSEIEFLVSADVGGCVVVYAGAAPGTHLRLLVSLFPSHTFVLVDPAPFSRLPKSKRIHIRQCMFTDALAAELRREFSDQRLLFISDVRTSDPLFHAAEDSVERIRNDMVSQARWHLILRPFRSLLKFRLPYTPGCTEYFKGDLLLPVWGPATTTECRLSVATDPGIQLYDHAHHEQKMFHFNTIARVALYPHAVCGCGIDHCYDCTAEVTILGAYLRCMRRRPVTPESIAKLSASISAGISTRRTLAHGNLDPELKTKVMRRQRWRDGIPRYDEVQKIASCVAFTAQHHPYSSGP